MKKEFLLEHITLKVEEHDKEAGEREIQLEEIEMAIMQLKGGKSPGVDGLTNEFYKTFKDKLYQF